MLHLDSEWTVADLDDGEEGCNFTPLIENFKQRNGHLGDPYPPPPLSGQNRYIFPFHTSWKVSGSARFLCVFHHVIDTVLHHRNRYSLYQKNYFEFS